MTYNIKWMFLQLFAGEGAGSGGTGGTAGDGQGAPTTGEGSVDAAQLLRDRGVPESKIKKYNRAKPGKAPAPAASQPAKQAAAAPTETAPAEGTEQHETPKYNWDEVMKDPECNRRMQETVKASKQKSKAAEDAMEALTPAIRKLAQDYGMDAENIDYVALSKHVTGEYEDKALEMGLPADTVAKMDQQQRTIEQQKNQQHIQKVIQQGEAMKAIFPNFDLRKEMENPVFLRLTSPGVGISVEDAYHLVHRKELEIAQAQVVAQQTTRQVQNQIRAGSVRPDESGSSTQAPSVSTMDWKHATKEQIQAQAKRIRSAAAQGRHLRPGE